MKLCSLMSYIVAVTMAVTLSLGKKVASGCAFTPYWDLDESYHLLGGVPRRQRSRSVLYDFLGGDKQCPNEGTGSRNNNGWSSKLPSHITNTTCPGYLVLGYDAMRKPKVIVEVRCACKKCLKKSDNECIAVNYFRNVKRKQCEKCVYCEVMEKVQVGCTCKLKTPITQTPPKPQEDFRI